MVIKLFIFALIVAGLLIIFGIDSGDDDSDDGMFI